MRGKNPETIGAAHTGILKLITIVIAVIVSFLLNIFTSHEVSIFALKKETNFAEEIIIIDGSDILEINNMSVEASNENDDEEIDNERTEENI